MYSPVLRRLARPFCSSVGHASQSWTPVQASQHPDVTLMLRKIFPIHFYDIGARAYSSDSKKGGNNNDGKAKNEAEEGILVPAEAEKGTSTSSIESEELGLKVSEGLSEVSETTKLSSIDDSLSGKGRNKRRKVRETVLAVNQSQNNSAVLDGASETSIVPAGPRPDNFPKVVAVPLTRRPLFPGFYIPINLKKSKLLDSLIELRAQGKPYVGAFLLKDKSQVKKSFAGSTDEEEASGDVNVEGRELLERMHPLGTFAEVTQVVRSLDGNSAQVLLLGLRRLKMNEMVTEDPLTVSVEHLKDEEYDPHSDVIKATVMELVNTMKDLMKMNPLYKEHISLFVQNVGGFNASRMADFGAALTTADEPSLQAVLQELNVENRLAHTLLLLKKEMELSKLQASIAKNVEEKISGDQRKFFLNEQLKAIKKELGLEKDDKTTLIGKFRDKLEPFQAGCPPHILEVIEDEIVKLQGLEPSSSEFNVTRNYLDWLTSIPWGSFSEENFDVKRAQKILDDEHFGLDDVKERILEFIAVGKLKGSAQGKIICLLGPPGVGKTSIGRSIANALNRKFYRFPVGGLFDVAEIKGHRRTYVGAMPGKAVQCLKATQSSNPLVLIDEIDKLGRGHSGDPASALLELLDPEQNSAFMDHYLDVPIDLSKVLFVCTANVLDTIPAPLLDRMEVVRLVGYITNEKKHIARGYLEPSARKASGVALGQVEITDGALHSLIEEYCREAGVRSLQKQIEKIYRKVALKVVRLDVQSEADQIPSELEVTAEEGPTDDRLADMSDLTEIAKELMAEEDKTAVLTPKQQSSPAETAAMDAPQAEPRMIGEKIVISTDNLGEYAGQPIFQNDKLYEKTPVGVVMGLAWTAMGGSTLYVETSVVEQGEGKAGLSLTGQLGDVMKESATIAHTVARRILNEKLLEGSIKPQPGSDNFFSVSRLHLHVPAGATPKDGPSAGCTMITSLLSLAIGRQVRADLAMTGEVTLTGRVLPIGGVKEKTVAARRSGVRTVIFPLANKRDFDELPEYVKEGLDAHFVSTYEEIFRLAFEDVE